MKDIIKKETCPHCKKEYLLIIKYSIISECRRKEAVGCPYCRKALYEYPLGKNEDLDTKEI